MIDRDETFRPQTFMGHKLNELGEVEGAIPVMKHFTDELHDRIIQEHESYVYRMCMELNIDPKVLEKQLIEIKRLQFVINQKDDEIKELKEKIRQCNKLLYSDGISDGEVCAKIMEIL